MRHCIFSMVLGMTAFTCISAEMSDPGKLSLCQIPDIAKIWNLAPKIVEGSHSRNDVRAGSTEQLYRLTLEKCSSNECNGSGFQASMAINIPKNGRFRVAIDQMLWIDFYDPISKLDGVLCEYASCAPIKKIVQFDLQAGPHLITLSGKTASEVSLLVTRIHN